MDDSQAESHSCLPAQNAPHQAAISQRVYAELRHLAQIQMRRERGGHTLQPTALVNEAYIRLVKSSGHEPLCLDRPHFLAVAAQVMRRVLVDHARARQAHKRGGVQQRVTFDDGLPLGTEPELNVLALNEALDRLAELDRRQCNVVEFRFFGGLTFEEIAEIQGVAIRTVKRDWSMARSWLHSQLSRV